MILIVLFLDICVVCFSQKISWNWIHEKKIFIGTWAYLKAYYNFLTNRLVWESNHCYDHHLIFCCSFSVLPMSTPYRNTCRPWRPTNIWADSLLEIIHHFFWHFKIVKLKTREMNSWYVVVLKIIVSKTHWYKN